MKKYGLDNDKANQRNSYEKLDDYTWDVDFNKYVRLCIILLFNLLKTKEIQKALVNCKIKRNLGILYTIYKKTKMGPAYQNFDMRLGDAQLYVVRKEMINYYTVN